MNIIIPIGGSGKRFVDDGYILPKPLVKSLGKPIIFWNLENLKTSNDDIIFITYRKEFEIYNFEDLITNQFYDKKIKFIKLSSDTRGSSETVLFTISQMNKSEMDDLTLVVDSDNFFREDIVQKFKNINNNLIFYSQDSTEKPIFSYIIKDSDGLVTNIEEKIKISDLACVGAYGFKNANILKETIESVIVSNKKENNEFYISSVYKKLISDGTEVFSEEIIDFVCLGTPAQLKSFSSILTSDIKKYRFCFDLDNTLVTYPKIKNDYSSVLPIQRNINYCNFLSSLGHTIIIYTARRMRTHFGNLGSVVADIGKVTLDTLDKFNINYDELHFGKPYAHFYIDDLAIKSYDDLEKEIGFYDLHPNTREHNRIEIAKNYVTKFSTDISGEKFFYLNIPNNISNYFPSILDSGDDFIKISKINGIPLSFLNTSKTLSEKNILDLLETINNIHNSLTVTVDEKIYDNYSKKFKDRVCSYNFEGYSNFNLFYDEISDFLDEYEKNDRGIFKVIHGDPVFTNILITNEDNFKFIDMRGKIGSINTIFGDIFYDYSKIYQSIIGYDFVLMDKKIDIDYIENNKKIFKNFIISNFGENRFEDIKTITKSLLISLIPIHNNEKCVKYYELISNV
jgi:capsule biosynthesis phosphatase